MGGIGQVDFEELEESLPYNSFICNYKRPHFVMGFITLGFTLVALSIVFWHLRTMHSLWAVNNGILWDVNGYLSPVFLFFGLMFLAWTIFYFMSSRNQMITIVNRTISWRNFLGKVKVQAHFAEVQALSLRQSWFRDAYTCEVKTFRGTIRWDSSVSSAAALLALTKKLARQQDLF